jgi:predicted TIM-barrel fold metal-dependent hydrolase
VPTIDADAHVIETERTWEFMEPSEEEFRPIAVSGGNGKTHEVMREFWRIEKRIMQRRLFELDRVAPTVEQQEMKSIEKRLRHMDQLGVDTHVLYPTLFLQPVTNRAEVEVALYRSYNRWLADIWKKGEKRLRWAAMAPTLDMAIAVKEIGWAKQHGACAVFMRGFEGDRLLSDPYFHPLYTEAARLDMPICFHSGTGSWMIQNLCTDDMAIFLRAKLNVVGTLHELIMKKIPQQFPTVRWGMIETSASWVPYLCHDLAARLSRMFDTKIDETRVLQDNNIWVACQTDDDLEYVLRFSGEDHLIIGSDYGHADTSSELEALRNLKKGGKISADAVDKILEANPRKLYAL